MGDFNFRHRDGAVSLTADGDNLVAGNQPLHDRRALLGQTRGITNNQFDFFAQKSAGLINLFGCDVGAVDNRLAGFHTSRW